MVKPIILVLKEKANWDIKKFANKYLTLATDHRVHIICASEVSQRFFLIYSNLVANDNEEKFAIIDSVFFTTHVDINLLKECSINYLRGYEDMGEWDKLNKYFVDYIEITKDKRLSLEDFVSQVRNILEDEYKKKVEVFLDGTRIENKKRKRDDSNGDESDDKESESEESDEEESDEEESDEEESDEEESESEESESEESDEEESESEESDEEESDSE